MLSLEILTENFETVQFRETVQGIIDTLILCFWSGNIE